MTKRTRRPTRSAQRSRTCACFQGRWLVVLFLSLASLTPRLHAQTEPLRVDVKPSPPSPATPRTDPNTPVHDPSPVDEAKSVQDLQREALALEKAGKKREAAARYEDIVVREPTTRLALAAHMVRLYAQSGATNEALAWAKVVTPSNPDPQAYLAGVHELLGDAAGAEHILRDEIGREKNPPRLLLLHWQLAHCLEASGQLKAGKEELDSAVRVAPTAADREVAERRRQDFLRLHPLASPPEGAR